MSFPSIAAVAQERNINLATLEDESVARDILGVAIKRDCPEAIAYLHDLVHKAEIAGETIEWSEDPNSKLGKELIRLFASDAVRDVVKERYLHGRTLVFCNCCGGIVPPDKDTKPKISAIDQIHFQAGPIAYADC